MSKKQDENVVENEFEEESENVNEEQIKESYTLKLKKTTRPKDVADDEDHPVKAIEKHYDIHRGEKKVGEIIHHYNEYGGHFYHGDINGKRIPYDRHNGPGEGAKAFIDGVAKTKWHAKTIKEESIAGATLKANSRSAGDDPKSKIDYMTKALGTMNAMKKEDLTKWYDQAMALIGKEDSALPSGASADSNSSSIDMKGGKGPKTRDAMPKINVKEDVEEMFVDEELSEEFKDKATTLFEAAVNARTMVEIARLEEEYDNRLEEEVTSIVEDIESNLNNYLDHTVENWMKDNEVAIESALRNEIMEDFIGGLKNLFVEHYIDMPEEKVDVVEEMAAKIERLEVALDETISENNELRDVVIEAGKQEIIDEMSESLTLADSEKFASLAEGIEFNGDLELYKKKLTVVKENYFQQQKSQTSNIEEETFDGDGEQKIVSYDPSVSRYVQAISKTIKK